MRRGKIDSRVNRKERIILGVFCFVILLVSYISLCSYYLKFASFDLETLLFWDYSSLNNLIPYKDVYYPYGLLTYYKNANVAATLLYFVTPIVTFSSFFIVAKRIYENKIIAYLSSFVFLTFIIFVSGMDIFYRYGIGLSFALGVAYLVHESRFKDKKILLGLGLITSSIFWLVHDQGFYCALIFAAFFALQKLSDFLKSRDRRTWVYLLIAESFYIIAGLVIGILPFLYYLVKTGATSGFLYYIFTSTPEFPELSKTPFFNSFISVGNVFSFLVLSFSVFLLVFKAVLKQKRSVLTYAEVGLVVLLLLLEQKNIIRAMEVPVALASFTLFLIVLWDVLVFLKLKKRQTSLYYVFTTLSILLLFLVTNQRGFATNDLKFLFSMPSSCREQMINDVSNEDHAKVMEQIREYKDFNNKILSFPGEPIFYVLLSQDPPFYTSIYEASSKQSQEDLIRFTDKNIKYVVIDISNRYIQDTVPNYVRGRYLLDYLLSNYSPIEKVDNFLILKKSGSDFFSLKLNDSNYLNFLLNVDLQSIPYSEGTYKLSKVLPESSVLVKDSESKEINKYLAKNELFSKNTFLLARDRFNTQGTIKITSNNNLTTIVKFRSCVGTYCIINLQSLPLFFKNKRIKKIEFNGGSISIMRTSNKGANILW